MTGATIKQRENTRCENYGLILHQIADLFEHLTRNSAATRSSASSPRR
jgi:hypothetical protein